MPPARHPPATIEGGGGVANEEDARQDTLDKLEEQGRRLEEDYSEQRRLLGQILELSKKNGSSSEIDRKLVRAAKMVRRRCSARTAMVAPDSATRTRLRALWCYPTYARSTTVACAPTDVATISSRFHPRQALRVRHEWRCSTRRGLGHAHLDEFQQRCARHSRPRADSLPKLLPPPPNPQQRPQQPKRPLHPHPASPAHLQPPRSRPAASSLTIGKPNPSRTSPQLF